MIELPTLKTATDMILERLIITMYAPPKTGKSTFASQFPDAMFINSEGTTGALEIFDCPVESWGDIIETGKALKASEHGFKTLVFDTIDQAYLLCQQHMCRQWQVKHPVMLNKDATWMGGQLVAQEFRRVMQAFFLMGHSVVMLSHAKTSTYRKVEKIVPSLPAGARTFLMNVSDIILYADVETVGEEGEQRRVMYTQPSEMCEAGDRTGKLPPRMPLSYEALRMALEGGENE